jgi:DNA-binding CsgD family transcriptional regulator/sugar-specific transcriptional regulator TrmB
VWLRNSRLRIAGNGVPLLTAWGLSPDADLIFRTLVEHGPQTGPELCRALGLVGNRVHTALDELVDRDAVQPEPSPVAKGRGVDARRWRHRPVETVLAALRERRRLSAQAALRARRQLRDLSTVDADCMIDVNEVSAARQLLGVSRVRARLAELVHATRYEHLSMHPEPAFSRTVVQAAAPLDHDLAVRQVSVLALGVPPSVEDSTTAHLVELSQPSVHYRELPTLPTKMIIFDRRVAIVPLDPRDTSKGALELFSPSAVRDLAAWFLRRWAQARPPDASSEATVRLSPREQRIITLLAAGHTDATAAAELGLSQRTVAYAIHDLMDRHGVQNRFQLGLVLGAARHRRADTSLDGSAVPGEPVANSKETE